MSAAESEVFDLRSELDRIQLAARLAVKKEELQEAVESLGLCVQALMDSFGIQTIRIRQAKIMRPGDSAARRCYIFEQHDHSGKIVSTRTVGSTQLIVVE